MRLNTKRVEQFRLRTGLYGTDESFGMNGAFRVPKDGVILLVIASNGDDWEETGMPLPKWEHVSVSTRSRCPTWYEMAFVKRLFWRDDETVIQLHVPRSQHLNLAENCLHLWKPIGIELPMPPQETVAPKTAGVVQ